MAGGGGGSPEAVRFRSAMEIRAPSTRRFCTFWGRTQRPGDGARSISMDSEEQDEEEWAAANGPRGKKIGCFGLTEPAGSVSGTSGAGLHHNGQRREGRYLDSQWNRKRWEFGLNAPWCDVLHHLGHAILADNQGEGIHRREQVDTRFSASEEDPSTRLRSRWSQNGPESR